MTDPRRQRRERGLEQALDRLRASLAASGDDPLIPFTEALNWLYYVKEWHKNDKGGDSALRSLCEATDEGKTFLAIIWARGIDTHGNRDVADLILDHSFSGGMGVGGMGTSAMGGAPIPRWSWAGRSALRSSPGRTIGDGVHYETFVAGRSIIQPLVPAKSFVDGLP